MSQLPSQPPTQLSFPAQPLPIGQGMDSAILSLTHSPASRSLTVDSAGPQRKITLLTRSQPTAGSMHTTSLPQSSSSDASGSSVAFMTSTGPVQGRAARDDYYDTEDPSVNLHEFIVNSMQAPKNRVILLKLEEEFFSYVADHTRVDPLKLPPWDSYHRMLAHRVAAYFGLEHNVDPMDKNCVVVCKGPNTRIPKHRFSDYMKGVEDIQAAEPKLILKRSPKEVSKLEQLDAAVSSSVNAPEAKGLKSFEEREEEYEKARARIFNQLPPTGIQTSPNTIAFDLATRTTPRTSSLFSSMMHHRRAASDTAMFSRPLAVDLKKDETSSSQGSRSATPLISSRPSEVNPQPLPSPQKSPPHATQQTSQNEQQYSLQTKLFSSVKPDLPPSQQSSNVSPSSSATTVQLQPLQASVPLIYHHQQPAMVDPGWYYQQMMLYQMSQQNCIARPQFAGVQPFVHPGTMFPRYAVATGVVGQSSPSGAPAASSHVELPSPHPASGVLVRPIPQQPSPVRLPGKLESQAHFAPSIMAQQFPMSPQTNPAAFATLIPVAPQGTILAEQMKAMTISDSASVEKRAMQGMTTGDEESNSLRSQESNLSEDRYHSNGVSLNRSEAVVAGHFSPHSAVHFLPPQQAMYGNGQEGSFGGASMLPGAAGGLFQYSSPIPHPQAPVQPPSTPPIGTLTLAPPGVVHAQQQQGILSTTSTSIQSPVQILGHTLGTSLFSPPPSSTSQHGIFVNSPTTTGKVAFPSVFHAVGSGSMQHSLSEGSLVQHKQFFGENIPKNSGNSTSQLPPRHQLSGNRYQNQRHPSNKVAPKVNVKQTTGGEHVPSQGSSTGSGLTKREPLLPTPPSTHMVKLDTTLTCGVPLNVMEIVKFPSEGSPDKQKAIEALVELGAKDFKSGRMAKCGENVMIVVFDTPERAMSALQSKHPLFSLSIPRSNHSKFIMTIL